MGLLNDTFGIAGNAQEFFGGQWWLVGLLLIISFLLYFYSKGIPTEGIVLFIFAAILLVTIDNLFTISQDIIMTVIVFILIFIGLFVSRGFAK